MLRHPCILRDPQQRGTKSEVTTLPLPSRGPKRGRECYVTPTFLGVPNAKRGDRNPQSSYTANSILGTVHKGTICGGKRPKKVRIVTKIRGERVYRGICYIKIACVYVPLYCLYSRIITQTAHRRARRRVCRKISTPIGQPNTRAPDPNPQQRHPSGQGGWGG